MTTNYTGQDFLDAFAKHYGFTIKEGTKATAVLLPHIMMNVAYEYYQRDIKPLDLKRELKQYRNRWAESYTKFNRYLFDAFDADMADAFCDKMDDFRRFMYQDIISLQSKMMRCLPVTMDADKRRVMAAAMLSNRIAKLAEKMWFACYVKEVDINNCLGRRWFDVDKKGRMHRLEPSIVRYHCTNNGLSGVLTNTKAFGATYAKDIKEFSNVVEDNVANDLFDGLDAFENKCLRFIDFDRN